MAGKIMFGQRIGVEVVRIMMILPANNN